jgi:hypothetical protein
MKLILALLISATAIPTLAASVKGYVRKDGTYVAPHYRSNPNSTKLDNYSTQGNVNPYTGQQGTVNPYQPQPQYQNPYGQQQPRQPRY